MEARDSGRVADGCGGKANRLKSSRDWGRLLFLELELAGGEGWYSDLVGELAGVRVRGR